MRKNMAAVLLLAVLVTGCGKKESVKPEMVLVKGGTYDWKKLLGLGTEEVSVRDLYVQKYETTKTEWEAFINATGRKKWYDVIIGIDPYKSVMSYPESAAVGMTFFEAVEYCNWRSREDGYKPVYKLGGKMPVKILKNMKMPEITVDENADGYRLPVETEWIYAALGGNEGIGSRWWEHEKVSEYAWINVYQIYTEKVGQLKANPLGLYDVFGNAWEWCWDIKKNSTGKEVMNPSRFITGYCMIYTPFSGKELLNLMAISSLRGGVDPLLRYYIGIRMVRNAE